MADDPQAPKEGAPTGAAANTPQEEALEVERLAQKQQQNDPLVDLAGKEGDDFLTRNRRNITIGVFAIVIFIAGWYLFFSTSEGENAGAAEQAQQTFGLVEQDSFAAALQPSIGRYSLTEIAEEFSGTPTGNLAHLLAGVSHLEVGNNEAGLEQLKAFKQGDNMISAASYYALGVAYENQGEFSSAAKAYANAANTNENSATSPFFLMHQGRALELAGDVDAAADVYQALKERYPNSQEGRDAEKYLFRLQEPS